MSHGNPEKCIYCQHALTEVCKPCHEYYLSIAAEDARDDGYDQGAVDTLKDVTASGELELTLLRKLRDQVFDLFEHPPQYEETQRYADHFNRNGFELRNLLAELRLREQNFSGKAF